jgi:aspartate kinase
MGEDLCAQILVGALRGSGYPAQWVDARRFLRTDSKFGGAEPQTDAIREAVAREVAPRLAEDVVVVQGFIGADASGETTTLGRGGSDTTAGLLGAALRAEEIQIWTDVDGILSADPRVVPHARVVSEIGFEEAIELSYFGARVLHPPAAKHAAAAEVPLRVLNTFNPDAPGTLVRPDARTGTGVAAVAFRGATALVTVRSLRMFMAYGFLARVFDVVARHQLAIDLIATSHTSTSFTVAETGALEGALGELRPFCEIMIEHGFATVSVIGHGLLTELGIAGRVFSALGGMEVRLITQASDVSLNFLVAEGEAPECARRLHEALIQRRAATSGGGLPGALTDQSARPGT